VDEPFVSRSSTVDARGPNGTDSHADVDNSHTDGAVSRV
jgi:hypothetical protein